VNRGRGDDGYCSTSSSTSNRGINPRRTWHAKLFGWFGRPGLDAIGHDTAIRNRRLVIPSEEKHRRSENVRHNFRVSAVALFLIIATGFVSRVESRTNGIRQRPGT
jgi:hypothetical protein